MPTENLNLVAQIEAIESQMAEKLASVRSLQIELSVLKRKLLAEQRGLSSPNTVGSGEREEAFYVYDTVAKGIVWVGLSRSQAEVIIAGNPSLIIQKMGEAVPPPK